MQSGPRGSACQVMFSNILSQYLVNIGSLESGAQVREEGEGEGKLEQMCFAIVSPKQKNIPNNSKLLITCVLSGLQEKEC